jgi:hypothetical protein
VLIIMITILKVRNLLASQEGFLVSEKGGEPFT